jgi:hypothetical protein
MKKFLVSATILLLGGAGILLSVFHRSNVQPILKASPPVRQTTNAPSSPAYLVIKEWNVRFLLPSSLQGDSAYGIRKDVNLAVGDTATPVYGDVAYFASKHLALLSAEPNNCGLAPGAYNDKTHQRDSTSYDGGPGISLARTSSRIQPQSDDDIFISPYWYHIEKGSAASCYQDSDGTQETQFIMRTQEALKKLEKAPPQ